MDIVIFGRKADFRITCPEDSYFDYKRSVLNFHEGLFIVEDENAVVTILPAAQVFCITFGRFHPREKN